MPDVEKVRGYAGIVVGVAVVGVYLWLVITGAISAADFGATGTAVLAGYLALDGGAKVK